MSSIFRYFVLFALIVFLTPSIFAKGATVKIEISSAQLSKPISVTDPDIVGEFNIWSGPNSRWRSKNGSWITDYSFIFIDFPGGVISSPPDNLFTFDVEFHIAGAPDQPPVEETYKVQYAINPSENGGYMYLPTGNLFVYHGVEGNWFRSIESWEKLVRPIVEQTLLEQQN